MSASGSDPLDEAVAVQMQAHGVVGMSLAIVDDGGIVKARGYGVTDRASQKPVTPDTLFQAASVSKSVTALGALRLVEQGKLALDEPVNARLQSWKVPENAFAPTDQVTLRGILSHYAGLTVHGFHGYAAGEPLPTLRQILDGAPPANSSPIRVGMVPGTKRVYSGGGYTVLQQLMMDAVGQSFSEWMRESVLQPFGMEASNFAQPLPPTHSPLAATGHHAVASEVSGRWYTYPEMAAAGLWSTASDLARLIIGIQQSFAGKSNPVISPAMTRQMLTPQPGGNGLGVFLIGFGSAWRFYHPGKNAGFEAIMLGTVETGKGAVLMINSRTDPKFTSRIFLAIAKNYRWGGTA